MQSTLNLKYGGKNRGLVAKLKVCCMKGRIITRNEIPMAKWKGNDQRRVGGKKVGWCSKGKSVGKMGELGAKSRS